MSQIIQMKITLEGIRPPIWRRVLVDKKSTLADLHSIIQETNYGDWRGIVAFATMPLACY